MRGSPFVGIVVLSLLIPSVRSASAQTFCGGSTTLIYSLTTYTDGGTIIATPIDVAGATYQSYLIASANDSIALTAGVQSDYIHGGDFWNPIDPADCNPNSDGNETCNGDPIVIAEPFAQSANGQFTMTSVGGNGNQNTTRTTVFVATANLPTSLHSGWTKFSFVGCDRFPSYPVTDRPITAYTGNWIIVEVSCTDSSGTRGGSEIHAIEKSALYSGSFADHTFVSSAPSNFWEAPLSSLNEDSTAYLATTEPGDNGATVVVSKITGSASSPSYTFDIGTGMISVSGTKGGGGKLAKVPDLDQAGCTYCLGHAQDFVIPSGDEDTWASGHAVLEVAFAQKYGGTSENGVQDGSAISEVVTWDTVTKTTPFTFWTQDSTKGGGIAHSWPSVAHAVVSGSDHVVLTDTLARHQSGNTHHPTNEVLRIKPSLSTVVQNESPVDQSNSTPEIGNRWGDYSTTMYDPSSVKFESFGDCVENLGYPVTVQFNTYNEVVP
jgi:hypothetical protein